MSKEDRAAAEARQHHPIYSTQYDGKGGIKWKDDGGLICRCGKVFPRPTPYEGRPYDDYYRHVARAVLQAGGA